MSGWPDAAQKAFFAQLLPDKQFRFFFFPVKQLFEPVSGLRIFL